MEAAIAAAVQVEVARGAVGELRSRATLRRRACTTGTADATGQHLLLLANAPAAKTARSHADRNANALVALRRYPGASR